MTTTPVTCPHCGYSKPVLTAKLPRQPTTVGCPSCKKPFRYSPPAATEKPLEAPGRPPRATSQNLSSPRPERPADVVPPQTKPPRKSAPSSLSVIGLLLAILLGLVGGRLWLDEKARSVPFPYWLAASDQGIAVLYGDEFYVVDQDGRIQWSQNLPAGTVPCQISWQGNELWVADWKNDRILQFDGTHMAQVPLKGPAIEAHLNVAVDKTTDRLFIADSQASRIAIYDASGNYIDGFGQKGRAPGQLFFPKDIRMASNGLLIVGNTLRPGVDAFKTDGTFVRTLAEPQGKPGYFFLTDFAIDQQNLVTIECDPLVTDCVVASYDRKGRLLNTQPQPPAEAAGDVALWSGVAYVSDCVNRRVVQYDAQSLSPLGPLSVDLDNIGTSFNKREARYRLLSKLSLVLILVCFIAMLWIYKRTKSNNPSA